MIYTGFQLRKRRTRMRKFDVDFLVPASTSLFRLQSIRRAAKMARRRQEEKSRRNRGRRSRAPSPAKQPGRSGEIYAHRLKRLKKLHSS